MNSKKIIYILIFGIIILFSCFVAGYFCNKKIESIERAYVVSYSLLNNDKQNIESKNEDEIVIYKYFEKLSNELKELESSNYRNFINNNVSSDFYKNIDINSDVIKSYNEKECNLLNDVNKNSKKENFIEYLKSKRVKPFIVKHLDKMIIQEQFVDAIKIKKFDCEKEKYDNLINYNEYLKLKNNEWYYKDNSIVCKNKNIESIIVDKNKELGIDIKVSLEVSNTVTKTKVVATPDNSKKIPVLMYHGVSDVTWGIENLFMKVSDFDKQMKYIHDNYETIFIEDIEKDYSNKKVVALTFDDGYVDFYTNVLPILKKYNLKANLYTIVNAKGDKYLSDDQIIKISKSGLVSIGSHTVSHKSLDKLNEEDINIELKNSKEHFEKLLNKKIRTICYPSGAYSSKVLNITKKYYDYGLIIGGEVQNMEKGFNKYAIKRFRVYRNTSFEKFKGMVDLSN